MVGMTEIAAGVAGFKAIQDALKSAIAVRDWQLVTGKIGELGEKVFDLTTGMLGVQAELVAAQNEIRTLKEKLVEAENWDQEKLKYKLVEVMPGSFVMSYQATIGDNTPAHQICANCYERKIKSIMQQVELVPGRAKARVCHTCGSSVYVSGMSHPEHVQVLRAAVRR